MSHFYLKGRGGCVTFYLYSVAICIGIFLARGGIKYEKTNRASDGDSDGDLDVSVECFCDGN